MLPQSEFSPAGLIGLFKVGYQIPSVAPEKPNHPDAVTAIPAPSPGINLGIHSGFMNFIGSSAHFSLHAHSTAGLSALRKLFCRLGYPTQQRSMMAMIAKIVSGGQAGVDRAALDAAIELGVHHGGWCPKRRLAEDGPIPVRYAVRETPSSDYPQRTEWNVRDSDGTLVLISGQMGGGTRLTIQIAQRLGKPHLVVELDAGFVAAEIDPWVETNRIAVLNVAGPRETTSPGCYEKARAVMLAFLKAT